MSPSGAVVLFLTPDAPFDASVVMSFCRYVLFFASEDAGAAWTAQRDHTFRLRVSGRVAEPLADRLFGPVDGGERDTDQMCAFAERHPW